MDKIDDLFKRLSYSKFRSKFHLSNKDRMYISDKGLDKIESHAYDFINKRLKPLVILNDGRQTPWRGHPVFVAQHATGCCCRGCLEKWHGIKKNTELTDDQVSYIVNVLMTYIKKEYEKR